MILPTTSPISTADLLKALSAPAAAPAAPAAPTAHGAPPKDAEANKIGGKYVKRWWEGGRWNYDYGDKPGAHHSAAIGSNKDPKHEHTHELPAGHQPHPGGPEADFHQATANTFAPGSVHQVPHPDQNKAGEHIVVSGTQGGGINVRDAAGQNKDFKTHGDYEKWHRGVQEGAHKVHDSAGNHFASVEPRVGTVKNGVFQPRVDTGKANSKDQAWVINYNKEHPNAPGGVNRGFARSREHALNQVNKQFANIKRFADGAANQVAAPKDEIESRLKWRLGDDTKRKNKPVLDVTPEERAQLVGAVSQKYTPYIVQSAKKFADDQSGQLAKMGMTPDQFVESVYGVAPGAESGHVVAVPGGHLERIINGSLDNYDPSLKDKAGQPLGFGAYLTGAKGQSRGMLDHAVKHDMMSFLKQQTAGSGATARQDMENQQADADAAGESADELHTNEETTTDPSVWKQRQLHNMTQVAAAHPAVPADILSEASRAISQIQTPDQIERMMGVLNSLDRKYPLDPKDPSQRWGNYIADFGKSLEHVTALLVESMTKAMGGFVMRDKGVDPTHTYSHREGTEDHPRYYFRDQGGNYVRYTNAPNGHPDASSLDGDPAVHPAEPDATKAPQFFSPDGRKLSRAPAEGAEVQWNPSYHPSDPQNLWFGRWVEPMTGEHAYTYLDSDIRSVPELLLHQQNALTDVRLPVLRSYTRRLSTSPHLKDRVTALGLALVDQGRVRLQELGALKVEDAKQVDGLWQLGQRFIYADRRASSLLSLLTRGRHPEEPLMAVPMMKMNGDLDAEKIRVVGPHYLEGILEQIGLSGAALQVYHATQAFSREVQRLLVENKVPWDSACAYATAQVATDLGYDLRQEMNVEQTLPLIRQLLIDPVVVEVLARNAKQFGMLGDVPTLLPYPGRAISYVSLDLSTRTADEQDFSAWLHSYPAHNHARMPMQQAQAQPDAPSVM